MEKPLISVRVEPVAGSSLTYTGEPICLEVAIENASPSAIALPVEKLKHSGFYLKYADGKDTSQFFYEPRCPGCDAPAETDETLTTLAPGSSLRLAAEFTRLELEQFHGPDDVDVVCEFTIRSKVFVGGTASEQRAKASVRITGRRIVTK